MLRKKEGIAMSMLFRCDRLVFFWYLHHPDKCLNMDGKGHSAESGIHHYGYDLHFRDKYKEEKRPPCLQGVYVAHHIIARLPIETIGMSLPWTLDNRCSDEDLVRIG